MWRVYVFWISKRRYINIGLRSTMILSMKLRPCFCFSCCMCCVECLHIIYLNFVQCVCKAGRIPCCKSGARAYIWSILFCIVYTSCTFTTGLYCTEWLGTHSRLETMSQPHTVITFTFPFCFCLTMFWQQYSLPQTQSLHAV